MEVTYHCAVTSMTSGDGSDSPDSDGGYYRALDMFFSLDGGSDALQAVNLCGVVFSIAFLFFVVFPIFPLLAFGVVLSCVI